MIAAPNSEGQQALALIAGLDPAIHHLRKNVLRRRMKSRVQPGVTQWVSTSPCMAIWQARLGVGQTTIDVAVAPAEPFDDAAFGFCWAK